MFNHIRTFLILLTLLAVVACSGADNSSDLETAAQDTADFANIVTATGKVMPLRWADLSFQSGGRLISVVEEGAEVSTGMELAQIEANGLEQAVTQAEAALAAAEAQLALAQAGARQEDIDAAAGGVQIAQGHLTAAQGGLDDTAASNETSIKQAEAQLAQAKAEVNRAYADLALLQSGARAEEIAMYQARLNQAQSDFLIAENLHFSNFIDPGLGGGAEERARYARESARGARDAAQAQLNLAQSGSSPESISAASAVVSAMQAQVEIAEAALEKAQHTTPNTLIAEAKVEIAGGELTQAEASLNKLKNGNTPEEIKVLQAEVAMAEAALLAAEEALANTMIIAPFDGVIGHVQINEGEMAMAGVPVLTMGDINALRVETTDLNEVDAAHINLADKVTLTFDALPGAIIEGKLLSISPMASSGQGGTNFTAIIEMVDPPQELRWGMTAFVDIEVN